MKIYLAGPMRGIPEFNFPAFFKAGGQLMDLGHYVHDPAYEDDQAGFQWRDTTGTEDMQTLWADDVSPKSLKDVLVEDIYWILQHADAVAVLPGWEKSRGARAEVSAALAADIPVATVDQFLEFGIPASYVYEVPPMSKPDSDWPPRPTKDPGTSFTYGAHGEVRVTSATGGQKGKKLAQLGSLDPQSLLTVAEVSGFGAQKYERYNYLKGYPWSLSFDALQRHLLAFWSGEDIDPESGLPHLGHAAWHCLALLSFSRRELGTDDRFKQEDAA